MLAKISLLYVLYFILEIQCENQDFSNCKTHTSPSGYDYFTYYDINRDSETQNDSLLFDLHFSVRGSEYAHVLISNVKPINRGETAYEIELRDRGDVGASLRRKMLGRVEKYSEHGKLISPNEFRSYWIRIWKDGLIELGKESEDTALLEWRDPEPLENLKYFSFSGWHSHKATWYFDCKQNLTQNIGFGTIAPSDQTESISTSRTTTSATVTSTESSNQNRTPDSSTCSIYHSPSGYDYLKYYEINRSRRAENDSLMFELHFSVKGSRYAHVMMSEVKPIERHHTAYEIELRDHSGGGASLRRTMLGRVEKYVETTDAMISPREFRSYWIRVWKNGLIELGKESQNSAFLQWRDPEPLRNLRYFSFSGWHSHEATWFFNCDQIPAESVPSSTSTFSYRTESTTTSAPTVLIGSTVTEENENSTIDFSGCKMYISPPVYQYSAFYDINTNKRPENGSMLLDLHFSVMGGRYVQVLVSQAKPIEGRYITGYEIELREDSVIGASVRRSMLGRVEASVGNMYLISPHKFRSFWIHIWKDGLIELGKESEDSPFLKWKDPEPLKNLKYFSFSGWHGHEAKWYFDCDHNLLEVAPINERATVSTEIEQSFHSTFEYDSEMASTTVTNELNYEQDPNVDFSNCKIHTSPPGYNFPVFYEINRGKETDNDSLQFELHFSVKGGRYAHVLVSQVKPIGMGDTAYEIELAAFRAAIRKNMLGDMKASLDIMDLLSPTEFKYYWIRIWKDGLIELGREKEKSVLLKWKDPEPLQNLQYYSFSGWHSSKTDWYYDCNNSNQPSEYNKFYKHNDTIIGFNLTTSQDGNNNEADQWHYNS